MLVSPITARRRTARLYMAKFKNNPNAKLYYSDTDSIIINKPLSDKYVGKELGLFKLEHEINKGIFIRNKLYIIQNSNKDFVIKSSGVDSKHLNWDKFELLLKGESVITEKIIFNVKWKELQIDVVKLYIKLKGLDKIIGIEDEKDHSYKNDFQ